jgi:hypothetical protein
MVPGGVYTAVAQDVKMEILGSKKTGGDVWRRKMIPKFSERESKGWFVKWSPIRM